MARIQVSVEWSDGSKTLTNHNKKTTVNALIQSYQTEGKNRGSTVFPVVINTAVTPEKTKRVKKVPMRPVPISLPSDLRRAATATATKNKESLAAYIRRLIMEDSIND